jgi:hypothetical protein
MADPAKAMPMPRLKYCVRFPEKISAASVMLNVATSVPDMAPAKSPESQREPRIPRATLGTGIELSGALSCPCIVRKPNLHRATRSDYSESPLARAIFIKSKLRRKSIFDQLTRGAQV